MASKKSYLESLRNVSLFSSCSTKDLEKIAKAADEVTVAPGALIVDQGQTGREAFVIIKGSAIDGTYAQTVRVLGAGRHEVWISSGDSVGNRDLRSLARFSVIVVG